MSHARRWIVACIVLGLALRAGFALAYWTGKPLTHDEREYLALARSLARGEGYRYPADEPDPGTGQQFGRAPGYPAFLSTFIVPVPVDHVPRRVQMAQCVLGALDVWLIALIAGPPGGPRAGVAAAAIAAVYPPLVWMPSYALSETVFSTLALAMALALARVGGRRTDDGGRLPESSRPSESRVETGTALPSRSDPSRDKPFGDRPPSSTLRPPFSTLLSGVLAGAAILTRPAIIFFLPLGALWLWRRRTLIVAMALVLLAALIVLPWTIRNHRVYGRWIAVASEGGVTFWTGNHPLARGDGDLAANPELKRAELTFRAAHPGLTPEQLEPLYYRDALTWIGAHPGAWLALVGRKAFYTVVPFGPSYAVHSSRYVAASVVSYGLVLAAAIAGARRARAVRSRTSAEPLWLMAASTVLAGLVFFPQERFRLPVIDPALVVTAAFIWSERARINERTGRHTDI